MPLADELTVQQTYPQLLANSREVRSLKGCHNCRFNNWRLCTKVPPRDAASFYAANDWQKKGLKKSPILNRAFFYLYLSASHPLMFGLPL